MFDVAMAEGRVHSSGRWLGKVLDIYWVLFLVVLARPTFIPDLNTPFSAVADIIALVFIARSVKGYLALAYSNILLLSWPMLAFLSSIWSLTPTISAFHAVQFFLSFFVALVLYQTKGLQGICKLILLANLTLQLTTLALVLIGDNYIYDGPNLQGIYQHKNELGFFTSLQIMVGLVLFAAGWNRILTACSVVLAAFLLLKSGSATSIILTAIMILITPVLISLRYGLGVLGVASASGLALACAGALALLMSGLDPVSEVLNALGKDATLTGRDSIWAMGVDEFWKRPILGSGFLAYWNSPATSAEYLRFFIQQRILAFHNVYMEVAVSFGVMGLIIFLSTLSTLLIRGLVFILNVRSAFGVVPFIYTLWISILCLTENPIFWHSYFNLLLVALSAASSQRKKGVLQ